MNEVLLNIARYGEPLLMQLSTGDWVASVKMKINITGATFDVKAREKTPELAVRACEKNMLDAIAQLSSLKTNALQIAK